MVPISDENRVVLIFPATICILKVTQSASLKSQAAGLWSYEHDMSGAASPRAMRKVTSPELPQPSPPHRCWREVSTFPGKAQKHVQRLHAEALCVGKK